MAPPHGESGLPAGCSSSAPSAIESTPCLPGGALLRHASGHGTEQMGFNEKKRVFHAVVLMNNFVKRLRVSVRGVGWPCGEGSINIVLLVCFARGHQHKIRAVPSATRI
jgi:hypothetical protein